MKYHVARDGQPVGIFLEYEVRDGLKSGELRASDLYWREGMAEWLPLSTAADLADAISLNPYAPPLADLEMAADITADGRAVLATLRQRLRAALLDFFLISVCLLSLRQGESMIIAAGGTPTAVSAALVVFGFLAFLTLLIWNGAMLWMRGQTIGKRWVNIRIANYEDDANPGFVKIILLRWICNGLLCSIPFIGLAYFAADIGYIFRPDRRCIHDLIAGTHVVQGSLPKR